MSANEDFIKKLKQNAASKGAAADKAHAASSRANTKSASQQVQERYAQQQAAAQAAAAQIKANPSMLTAKITPITMAQTAAGVAKGNIPNAFQYQKESGFERAADIIGSGASSLVGGAANAMRIATTGKYSPAGMISRGIDKIRGTNYTEQNAANQKAFVDEMMDRSRLSSQSAKRGLGKAGQAGVDIGSAATQIGLMALTGGIAGSLGAGSGATGALTKGLMSIQQAGQGAYDAEKAGAGEGTQALYGILQGATAYATEGISNVGALGKIFGNGAVDSKIEQASANAISKFISSDAGRAIANRLATGVEAGLGEALEQNIQDALTPVYQRLTYDKNAKLNAEDMIYNGLVAGAVGGIVGSAGKNNLKALETENDARAATSRADAAGAAKAPSAANTTPNLSRVAPNLIKPKQNVAQETAQAPTIAPNLQRVVSPVVKENVYTEQRAKPEEHASSNPSSNEPQTYKYDYQPEAKKINEKTWYHGSGTENLTAQKLSPSATKIEGLLGSGIYLTDNPYVASGYAKGRSKKTGTPTVYESKVDVDKVLDMSKPLPDDVYNIFRTQLGYYADEYGYDSDLVKIDEAQKSGKSGVDIYRMYSEMLSDISHGEAIPISEFYDAFGELNDELGNMGYDAYTHEGGKIIGNKPHQVLVLLDPNGEFVEKSKSNIVSFEPNTQTKSMFPENSLGAKITTPKSNIPREAAQAPTINDSAKEVKLPAETENALKAQQGAPEANGIKVYRGYNRSDSTTEKNLAKQQTIFDVIGKPQKDVDTVPLSYYTESAEDAKSYADMDLNLYGMYKEAAKSDYINNVINGRIDSRTVDKEQWITNKANEIYKTLTGRDSPQAGYVKEHTIYPKNILDLTELGEKTTVDDIYSYLSKKTGIPETVLDDQLMLGGISEDPYDPIYTFSVLRNVGNTPSGQFGTRFVDFMKEHGYDAVHYLESGASHYAVLNEPSTTQTKTPSIFPENSLGAKITAPKSNIPLEASKNTASVQNAQSNELGAANSGFDPYSHLQNKYGTIQPGENPARVVDVPLKTSDDMNVSRGVRTALEAKATPDEAVGPIQDAVTAERFSFETIKDKDAAARAEATISQKGYETALRDWTADVRSGKGTKDLVAQGQVLYNNAVNAGDYKTSVDILADLIKMSHNGAQVTQANRMLKKLDPQYQLYALERQSQHISEELAAKFKKSGFDGIKLDEDLVRQFHEAKTQEARDAVMDKLKDDVASQIPSSWKDKWNAWRYLSMLGNPRTHVRNIVGNAGFVPVREVKNIIGAGIEKATGSDRTKSVLTMKDRNLVKYALNDYAEVADSVMKNGKFNDLASDLNERRQIFKNRGLEALRKGNSKALDAEDVWFAKNAYARSLAGYFKANGITAEALEGGKVSQEVVDKARAYSIKEAQKATYRDSNAFSDWISRIGKYHGDNKWAKAGSTAVDAILPFRRTPANILARAWEYSPGEFLNVLGGDIRKVWSGNMDASEMIDHISSGMTGTMLLGLGAYLASQGLLTGGKSDDDDKAALATQQGYQDYALNIGGKSITLDWLAPEALPLFTGAEIFKTMQQKSDGKITLAKVLTNFSNMAEPMIDMSMLQGVNDLIDSVKYSKGNSLFSIAATTAANYLSQGLPTLAGQLERIGEKERETTYIDKTSGIPTSLQYMLGKAANKIPGIEYQQRPYTDMFGQHQSTGNTKERVFNNLFNPAYVRDIKKDDVTSELSRLVNGKYMSGVPDLPDQKITYGGKDYNLDKDEYTKYAERVGQLEHKYAASMINNRVYSSMTDEQKADYLKTIISYAKDEAKREYINKNGGKYESQMDGVYNAQQAGIEPDDFYAYKKYLKDIDPDGGNATQLQEAKAIDKTDLTTQMKGKLWQMQQSKDTKLDKNPYIGTLAQAGLSPSKTIEIMEAFDTIDDAVKNNYVKAYKGPSAAQVKAAYLIQWLTRQGYNANQIAAITDVFTTWQMIPIDKPSKKATAFVNANPMP